MGYKEIVIIFDNLPPMPRNQSHVPMRTKTGTFIGKSPLARVYEEEVKKRLKPFPKLLDIFPEYDRTKHVLYLETTICNPEMLTQGGYVSQQSVDWDAHKIYHDCLFKHLDVDDSQAVDAFIKRRVSKNDNWYFESRLRLLPISHVYIE